MPQQWVPPPRVIRDITNAELATAAIIAGSMVEMGRTCLLYPLLTLKTRIQTDINTRHYRRRQGSSRTLAKRPIQLKRRLQLARLNTKRHLQEGKLYAGIIPTLLVTVPATGVYYGVRDVCKRMVVPYVASNYDAFFHNIPGSMDVWIILFAAFCADVIALMIRTPADTLAIRLQVASGIVEREYSSSHDRRCLPCGGCGDGEARSLSALHPVCSTGQSARRPVGPAVE